MGLPDEQRVSKCESESHSVIANVKKDLKNHPPPTNKNKFKKIIQSKEQKVQPQEFIGQLSNSLIPVSSSFSNFYKI